MTSLPEPEEAALEHSHAVARAIEDDIRAAGGWIPFARFMELALYAPGLGYYSAGSDKFGASGDFVTAPEMSSLFGQCLACQAAQVLRQGGDVLEIGAGSGKLAVDMMSELERMGQLPRRYFILELSADLRLRQQRRIERDIPHLASRFEWLDHLPPTFSGLILGNEVLDAMPVHLVTWRGMDIAERGVCWRDGRFAWSERPLEEGELLRQARALPPADFVVSGATAYTSEINLAAQGFVNTLAAMLERGVVLMLDYGFGAGEYYHPQRGQGTLMCHYRHHAHADPMFLPGLQDITAHVDFSAVARGARNAGLDLLGYAGQAHFLINCGLTGLLERVSPDDLAAYLPLAAQAQKLVSPSEMGELFKAIALGKGMDEPLVGFVRGDRRRSL